MITTLNLNRYRKARIWLGELPDLIYPVSYVVEHSFDAKPSAFSQPQYAAIEMIIPSAGRAIYGVLGAKFTPNFSGKFAIKVGVSEDVEKEVGWSFASKIDKVCAGLPVEYTDSIIDGAINAREFLGAGLLFFNCAACDEVGSSPRIFHQLSQIVVRLLASQISSISEEDLAVLVMPV